MARPRRNDVPKAVHTLLESWHQADDIDRRVASRNHGQAPETEAVPYGWLTWKIRRACKGEEHAIYNALRRTIGRMEAAGEVKTYRFVDNGHYAWIVLLRISVTKSLVIGDG